MAVCGRGRDGRGFVHIKAWKGRRLLTEAVVTSGEVRIKCRECGRWMRITIAYKGTPLPERNAPPDPSILSVLEAKPHSR